MRKIALVSLMIALMFGCKSEKKEIEIDRDSDSKKILKTIDNWNKGWQLKDVDLAIKDYSRNTDWTNAFGDRMQSKTELRQLLTEIFAMDFVMNGVDNYVNDDVKFLSDDIALLRSTNIRTGQKWSDGTLMNERYIHHLRVYQKINDEWKITDHMISQAHEKK
nr:hypothetical protein [uncultured Allomuricauda sp.]